MFDGRRRLGRLFDLAVILLLQQVGERGTFDDAQRLSGGRQRLVLLLLLPGSSSRTGRPLLRMPLRRKSRSRMEVKNARGRVHVAPRHLVREPAQGRTRKAEPIVVVWWSMTGRQRTSLNVFLGSGDGTENCRRRRRRVASTVGHRDNGIVVAVVVEWVDRQGIQEVGSSSVVVAASGTDAAANRRLVQCLLLLLLVREGPVAAGR